MRAVAAAQPSAARDILDVLGARSLRMVLVLLILWAALAIYPDTREAFLTAGNFSNLTAQVAEIVIIGVGMTLVILIGGIDLSVGSGMALTGVVAAKLQIDYHQSAAVAVLAALLVASLIGLWHGILVTRFQIPPFIATLGGLLSYRGIGLVLSDARGLSPMHDDFVRLGGRLPLSITVAVCGVGVAVGLYWLVSGEHRRRRFGLPRESTAILALKLLAITTVFSFFLFIYKDGMPVPVLVAAAATAWGAVLLTKTRLGRYAFAIGGNAEAARLSGVPVRRVTVMIYVLCGLLTAVAGVIAAARANGVAPGNAGLVRELHVITAVVIGGTSLQGGSATVVGTAIGALIFGTLSNGMNFMNVNSNWQSILTGAILVGASMLDSFSTRKRLA